MKKIYFCVSLALAGLMTACVDKNEAVDADSKPSWLGGSIYQELKEPQLLEGTFNDFVRLIDDLGMTETLNRTGSVTVFPANDEAFGRFYQSNDWGVTRYEDLSRSQKSLLLSNAMINNALLLNMLSNVSNTSSAVEKGVAVKHEINASVTDTVQVVTAADIPQGGDLWDYFKERGGKYLVPNAQDLGSAVPMMVHFTREHMLKNNITTTGDNSDFAILTGKPYQDGMAYVFDKEVVKGDVTCMNGYVHQVADVIVPPGNMTQVLRADKDATYFSRMLDYFSGAYPNQNVLNLYNAARLNQGLPEVDMVYDLRYVNSSKYPQDVHPQTTRPDGTSVPSSQRLSFDPGWAQYSPNVKSGNIDYALADIAAMFVPTDKAFEDFFLDGGKGAYLFDLYGKYKYAENTRDHLAENLDSLYKERPDIVCEFVNNLMKSSFVESVPSKFDFVQNDVSDYMGVTLDLVNRRADGKYDIKIANNGVIYKMTRMYSPAVYESVMGPAAVYPDMSVMGRAVKDDENMKVSFHYYLKAMKSNFAFFIPDNDAFDRYYVDPIYLGHDEHRVLRFIPDTKNFITCYAYEYDSETNVVGNILNNGAEVPQSEWQSLMVDILNYHTVVLDSTEVFGTNEYYKTKHGGEIRITGTAVGSQVMSGQQIDNGVTPAAITEVFSDKQNGVTYRIDRLIESPRNGVATTLRSHSVFSEFYDLCMKMGSTEGRSMMVWCGISNKADEFGKVELDTYSIFSQSRGTGKNIVANCSLDELGNVRMFNTYNYTLYAPNNTAMQQAYSDGLPKWEDIENIYEQNVDLADTDPSAVSAKQTLRTKFDQLKKFLRYHFQSTSIYADNVVNRGKTSEFDTFSPNDQGIALRLTVSGGSKQLTVVDEARQAHRINAADGTHLSNIMARDYWLDKPRAEATDLYTSSFCVVHEISEVLNPWKSTDADSPWTSAGSRAKK